MMKKIFALLLALVMALSLMACGQKGDNIGGEKKDDQTQTDGRSVDLRAEYDAGIKQVQEELGDNAPVLLEETAVEILNSYYPGLENAKLKQSVFFISPTATSCEVSMGGGGERRRRRDRSPGFRARGRHGRRHHLP